jgi:hypothetical protein
MLYERHRNGRGKVFGEVDICRNSFLSKNSFAGDEADIFFSSVEDSAVKEKARVRNSMIKGFSEVLGKAEVSGSSIENTKVFGSASVIGATVDNSVICGQAKIRGAQHESQGVTVFNSVIRDEARALDNAVICGITLDRKMRVGGSDVWVDFPPRYFEVNNEIAEIGITEARAGEAYIGCKRKPIEKWLKGARRFAKKVGWTEEMVAEISQILLSWLETQPTEMTHNAEI